MESNHSSKITGERVLQRSGLGPVLCDWQALKGGVSSSVYRMSYLDATGERLDAVVRCHGDIDFARNPHLAADEYACVSVVYDALGSVPRPLYLCDDSTILGRPFVIYRYVAGEVVSTAASLGLRIPAMASWLAGLHELYVADLGLQVSSPSALVPRQAIQDSAREPDVEVFEPQIRRLLQQFQQPLRSGNAVLLHGDYWSGNLIWQNQRLVAVIDWEDFGVGDALADLGCARLELLWAADQEAVTGFTEIYLRARGLEAREIAAALGYWDLCSVLPFAHTLATIAKGEADRSSKRLALAGFVQRAATALGTSIVLRT